MRLESSPSSDVRLGVGRVARASAAFTRSASSAAPAMSGVELGLQPAARSSSPAFLSRPCSGPMRLPSSFCSLRSAPYDSLGRSDASRRPRAAGRRWTRPRRGARWRGTDTVGVVAEKLEIDHGSSPTARRTALPGLTVVASGAAQRMARGRGRCRPAGGAAPGHAGVAARTEMARRRICSSWACAAICWANSAVWMPWKRPSSQPTSCACAMRSSASLGTWSSVNGSESRSSSSTSSGASPASSSAIDRRWISRSRVRDGVVERRGAHLLEQLLDHAADAHDLRGLLDEVGDRALGLLTDRGYDRDRLPVGAEEARSRLPVGSARPTTVQRCDASACRGAVGVGSWVVAPGVSLMDPSKHRRLGPREARRRGRRVTARILGGDKILNRCSALRRKGFADSAPFTFA